MYAAHIHQDHYLPQVVLQWWWLLNCKTPRRCPAGTYVILLSRHHVYMSRHDTPRDQGHGTDRGTASVSRSAPFECHLKFKRLKVQVDRAWAAVWALQKAGKLRREEMTLKGGGLVVTSKLVLTIYLADDLLSYTMESSGEVEPLWWHQHSNPQCPHDVVEVFNELHEVVILVKSNSWTTNGSDKNTLEWR